MSFVLFFFLKKKEPGQMCSTHLSQNVHGFQEQTIPPHEQHDIAFVQAQHTVQ